MTRLITALTILSFAAMSAACAAVVYEPPCWEEDAELVVGLWIQEHPDLPANHVYISCDMWAGIGLACVPADRDVADIQVYADESPCVPKPNGNRTLALAYSEGAIEVNIQCLNRISDDMINLNEFRIMMAHEIGHLIGIWDHVPDSCEDEKVTIHPLGISICGPAIMNSLTHPEIYEMTENDWLAYDLRDTSMSVIDDVSDGDDASDGHASMVFEYQVTPRPPGE